MLELDLRVRSRLMSMGRFMILRVKYQAKALLQEVDLTIMCKYARDT